MFLLVIIFHQASHKYHIFYLLLTNFLSFFYDFPYFSMVFHIFPYQNLPPQHPPQLWWFSPVNGPLASKLPGPLGGTEGRLVSSVCFFPMFSTSKNFTEKSGKLRKMEKKTWHVLIIFFDFFSEIMMSDTFQHIFFAFKLLWGDEYPTPLAGGPTKIIILRNRYISGGDSSPQKKIIIFKTRCIENPMTKSYIFTKRI